MHLEYLPMPSRYVHLNAMGTRIIPEHINREGEMRLVPTTHTPPWTGHKACGLTLPQPTTVNPVLRIFTSFWVHA